MSDSTVRPQNLPLFPNENDPDSAGAEAQHGRGCDDEDGEEMTAPRAVRSPADPTPKEVEDHDIGGRAVFRNWCRHCMRGRCREWKHEGSSASSDDPGVPVISFDYGYLCQQSETEESQKEAEESGSSPLLVMWDSWSKSPFTFLLPAKGLDYSSSDLAIVHVAAALTELGYKRIIVRTDGEAALVAFIRAVTQYWGGEVVAERSPVGDST